MAGTMSVHIPWYATGFRGDKLEAALREVAPVAVRYGAVSYDVWRSRDDRYKILQVVEFQEKREWQAYWDGPEMIRLRAVCSGWYQVPLLYNFFDHVAHGEGPARRRASFAPDHGEASPPVDRNTPLTDPR